MHMTSTWHITLKWSLHISRMMGQQPHHRHHHVVLMGRQRPLHPCNPKPRNKVLTGKYKWKITLGPLLCKRNIVNPCCPGPLHSCIWHITLTWIPHMLKRQKIVGLTTPPPLPHCLLYNRFHIARTPKPLYNHSIKSGFVLRQCSKLLLTCVIALWVGSGWCVLSKPRVKRGDHQGGGAMLEAFGFRAPWCLVLRYSSLCCC